jgi:hypothetical protein
LFHLKNDHEKPINEEKITFQSYQEFSTWKEELQISSCTSFVLKCAPYKTKESQIYYFYCNRAGTYKGRGNDIRQLKIKGTSKIGEQRSAYMKAIINT